MGDRAQVKILMNNWDNDTPAVYLYTHWDSSYLLETVKSALAKEWRWNDQEYLARIIFDEMISECQGEETGYGIGTSQHFDINRLITINPKEQTVIFEELDYPDLKHKFTKSFKDFIKDDE